MEYYQSKASRLCRIYPVFFGKRDVFGKIGNLLEDEFDAEKTFESLPDAIPTASLSLATNLLWQNGITPSDDFQTLTVKGIVNSLKRYLGMWTWEKPKHELIVFEVCKEVLPQLRSALEKEESGITSTIANIVDCIDIIGRNEGGGSSGGGIGGGDLGGEEETKSSGLTLTLIECKQKLREEMGIEATDTGSIIEAALADLNDSKVTSQCNRYERPIEKLRYLVRQISD